MVAEEKRIPIKRGIPQCPCEDVNYEKPRTVSLKQDYFLKSGMPTMFEEEPKARCPDCSQSLTFIRTKSHQKRWYCYACEKYVDNPNSPTMIKDAHSRIEALNGLQVIDSHGMIVGRVRKAISNETGDVRSFVLSVDKEQFKTLLDERDLPREFELGHEKIATVGDVVILSDVFSPSAFAPPKPHEETAGPGMCSRCNAPLIAGAKHCIKCGALLISTSCASCGTVNPSEARYCKNCGNRI